ncbi:hypothetical protein, partial [Dietzia sp. CQ4]|uniref:hypothetical protein n=1 Tax=Dietzia sp. (strain CQ4) TaxID=370437 RepID=UPI0019D661AC
LDVVAGLVVVDPPPAPHADRPASPSPAATAARSTVRRSGPAAGRDGPVEDMGDRGTVLL